MFSSLKQEAAYKPLSEEADANTAEQRPRLLQRLLKSPSTFHYAIIILELVLCLLLISGFIVLDVTRRSLGSRVSLDGLSQLGAYNTTLRFENGSHLLAGSSEADHYWGELLSSGGVVSLDTQWALAQGLRQSATSPTDSSQSIYQVDVFHALHCLVRTLARNFLPPGGRNPG